MSDPVRCSEWSRACGLDPIATIGCYSGFLLVEWPLPWPPDMLDVPELGPLGPALRERNVRLQGLVSVAGTSTGRVIYYAPTGSGAGASLQGRELVVERDFVVEAALRLLDGTADAPAVPPGVCDVLICTHGSRDRCCGALGTRLATRLTPGALSASRVVRLWRTSHTGGHRFAPTALVLPDATGWAFVDEQLLWSVVNRTGDVSALVDRYRGCSLLPDAESQVAEARAIPQIGWDAFSARRVVSRRTGGAVEIGFDLPDGRRYVSRAVVSKAGETRLPTCGEPLEAATKTQPEWRVGELEFETRPDPRLAGRSW